MIPFFRTILDREELGSTSDLARQIVEAGADDLPLVVRARRQTAGRGRGDHRWWSDEGSLTFTVAIDPTAHALRREHEPRLALAVAVLLIEVIESLRPVDRLVIRWPNDLECDGRKLAGILPERIESGRGPRLLIGVGVNVASRLIEAPGEVRAMAASLDQLGPATWDADALFGAFLGRFPHLLDRLAGDDPHLARQWSDRDDLLGREVRLAIGREIHAGLGAGIDSTGGLVLRTESGSRTYHGGQVLRGPS